MSRNQVMHKLMSYGDLSELDSLQAKNPIIQLRLVCQSVIEAGYARSTGESYDLTPDGKIFDWTPCLDYTPEPKHKTIKTITVQGIREEYESLYDPNTKCGPWAEALYNYRYNGAQAVRPTETITINVDFLEPDHLSPVDILLPLERYKPIYKDGVPGFLPMKDENGCYCIWQKRITGCDTDNNDSFMWDHFVYEWDDKSEDEQKRIINKIITANPGVVKCVTYSGGKSYHMVVKSPIAVPYEKYSAIWSRLAARFGIMESDNSMSHNRLSRYPNGINAKTGVKQQCMYYDENAELPQSIIDDCLAFATRTTTNTVKDPLDYESAIGVIVSMKESVPASIIRSALADLPIASGSDLIAALSLVYHKTKNRTLFSQVYNAGHDAHPSNLPKPEDYYWFKFEGGTL